MNQSKPSQVYIIEHLEPELGRWCMIEYERIFDIAQLLLEDLFSEAMESLRYLEESQE